ncbi:tetratricopeptide repeat protein [Rhodocytophaga aerolata]|uniref:Tetratricopeptide repeat protein n=1 Tax=Rhodocytophaga aerolata TaxID=455078 RepID=A0ABT8R552_9BACT|nr:tetratricopeptide repeat protein [Rhodocytophaga aerolata]MDO1447224.1 tetratricopeptide repeat protein [Rhodocytophaga aerolata]
MKNILLTVTFLLSYSWVWAQSTGKESYEKAIDYMNKGNMEQGFEYLNKSLAANPTFYDALYARGFYSFTQADYTKAIIDFDSLLIHYPQDTASFRYRGLSQMYLKNFQEAEKDLHTALSLDSTDHSIYSDLGYFYYQVMEYEAAKHYLEKSIRIKPSRFALYQKAQTHYSLNEFNEALTALAPLLKEDPKDADALRLQALVYLNTKKYPESIKIYEQLLANGDISEPDDFLNWGLTHFMQKKYTQALVYFTTPKKHTDAELYYYTGLAYYKLKDNKKALKALNKAVLYLEEAGEEQAPVFYDRAIVRSTMKDNAGAAQDYLQAVALLPEITRQRNQFGDTLALLGNASVLLKGLYAQKQLDSVSAIGYWQRAENLFEKEGLEEEALQAITYSIQLAPNKEYSLFTRAKIYYFFENYSKALQDVNKAIELNSSQNKAEHFHLRGLIYYQMEDAGKARQDFDKAIALEPENTSYYYERSFAWADTGNYAEALKDMNKAMSLDKETKVPYLMARADFYNQLGQFDKALADCEEIMLKSRDQAIVYYQRGLARFGLKKYSEAITDFTRAIQLEPDFSDARQKLQEALQAH